MQIAIEGPAGVGKSTLAKALAAHYGIIYLDTGAMYRGVSLMAVRKGVPAEEGPALDALLEALSLHFEQVGDKKCLFDHDENIEEAIRQPEISCQRAQCDDASAAAYRPGTLSCHGRA